MSGGHKLHQYTWNMIVMGVNVQTSYYTPTANTSQRLPTEKYVPGARSNAESSVHFLDYSYLHRVIICTRYVSYTVIHEGEENPGKPLPAHLVQDCCSSILCTMSSCCL